MGKLLVVLTGTVRRPAFVSVPRTGFCNRTVGTKVSFRIDDENVTNGLKAFLQPIESPERSKFENVSIFGEEGNEEFDGSVGREYDGRVSKPIPNVSRTGKDCGVSARGSRVNSERLLRLKITETDLPGRGWAGGIQPRIQRRGAKS